MTYQDAHASASAFLFGKIFSQSFHLNLERKKELFTVCFKICHSGNDSVSLVLDAEDTSGRGEENERNLEFMTELGR